MHFVKSFYLETQNDIFDTFNEHFYQAEQIRTLRAENQKLEQKSQLIDHFYQELQALKNHEKALKPELAIARVIAFVDIMNAQKFWLDFQVQNPYDIHGLVSDNMAVGIVKQGEGNAALALLNGHSETAYAVKIGASNAIGVAMGKNKDTMIVKYISSYKKINIGDEVVTSGLDGIFYRNVKVGKITQIYNNNVYLEAVVKPYFQDHHKNFYYVVTKPKGSTK